MQTVQTVPFKILSILGGGDTNESSPNHDLGEQWDVYAVNDVDLSTRCQDTFQLNTLLRT